MKRTNHVYRASPRGFAGSTCPSLQIPYRWSNVPYAISVCEIPRQATALLQDSATKWGHQCSLSRLRLTDWLGFYGRMTFLPLTSLSSCTAFRRYTSCFNSGKCSSKVCNKNLLSISLCKTCHRSPFQCPTPVMTCA